MKSFLVSIFLLLSLVAYPQEIKTITLKKVPVGYSPKSFHVVSITDRRNDTTNIGTIRVGKTEKRVPVNLKNNAAYSIQEYINAEMQQDTSTLPVSLHILKLLVKGKEQAKLTESVSLELMLSYKDEDVIFNTLERHALVNTDVTSTTDELIRTEIKLSIKYLDEWWQEHKNDILHPVYKIHTQFVPGNDTDRIMYNKDKALSFDDFKGAQEDSNILMQTYTNIAWRWRSHRDPGSKTFEVYLTPYFDKERSFCDKKYKTSYYLEHAQRYMDITAIKACELKHAIDTATLPTEFPENKIEELCNHYIKERRKLVDLYDRETQNGKLKDQQEKWDNTIKQQLKDLDCYK